MQVVTTVSDLFSSVFLIIPCDQANIWGMLLFSCTSFWVSHIVSHILAQSFLVMRPWQNHSPLCVMLFNKIWKVNKTQRRIMYGCLGASFQQHRTLIEIHRVGEAKLSIWRVLVKNMLTNSLDGFLLYSRSLSFFSFSLSVFHKPLLYPNRIF